MCVALAKSLSLSLSPQDPPQVHVLALITPVSDLISSLLSSVALNVVPLWILMTDWIGKWVIHLGKAGGMRGRGEDNGDKVGEREREIAIECYNHIHFLNKRVNIRLHMLGSKGSSLKGSDLCDYFSMSVVMVCTYISKEKEKITLG